jgi:hypothetical protein
VMKSTASGTWCTSCNRTSAKAWVTSLKSACVCQHVV